MEFVLSELCQQVMTARAAHRPVFIRGGGTKSFYGELHALNGKGNHAELDLSGYCGIINYQPSELVITARAGTLLSEIEQELDAQNQMLAFEPPRFGPASTIGGCVAAGLSGPRRMAAGSVRDYVLGAKLLDSTGMVLSFGGEVMKNVAGYDVSRLLAGSMGIFGAMVEVSIKVAPKPFQESTVVLEADEAAALAKFNQWRGLPLPISATAWLSSGSQQGQLWVRLSGSEPALANGRARLGGQLIDSLEAAAFWDSLRDQSHPFFQARPLWRAAVPPTTAALNLGPTLIEWNGGQRWLASPPQDGAALRTAIAACGGHATLFRYDVRPDGVPVFHPLERGLMNVSTRMKQELDPMGIFNPRRLFPEM
ncbi:MAG TPA: glycolate oxidase subunit GlcE [Eoetvoesiella sp.]